MTWHDMVFLLELGGVIFAANILSICVLFIIDCVEIYRHYR